MIIDVQQIVDIKKEELKEKVVKLKRIGKTPKLAVILANDDKASEIYVKKKRELCLEIGIEEVEYIYDDKVKEEEILEKINSLNEDESVNGILIQLPLFKHLNANTIINKIMPNKDVDGLTIVNAGKLAIGQASITPCTPKGIISILDSLKTEYTGKHAVIVGRSNLVGKPLSQLLLNKDTTVTICHSKTKELKKYTKEADILIVACGKANIITKDMVKKDSIVIDVGINKTVNGQIVGDCDTLNIDKKVKYITKVPGGVGLTTVISLIENVVSQVE